MPRRFPVRLAAVGSAAVAALAVGTGGVRAATDPATELALRYAPVVRIVDQEELCRHGEPYVPTDVSAVLGSRDVALRGPWDRTNIVKVAPTAADISGGLFEYHLDFPGNALTPGCVYDEWSRRINAGRRPVAYARVAVDPAYPGQLALQYWFFYVFNDFNDKHEGDWEMIQLDFDAATAAAALRTTPAVVGFSQHEGAERARWGDDKLELVGGTHPVVYPALGSHANYFSDALFLGRSAAQGVGCDDTNGPSRDLRPRVEVIPTGRDAYLTRFPWLGFDGYWGEQHQGFYNGPTGPNTKSQWDAPITWADTTWRSKSFTVPAGTVVGSTATGFFCGAVAAGSSVLTALVGNPSPVLIALSAILLALLWLTSRTRWHPSAPFRITRRRPWGAIVNASRRMYGEHLLLFLGIGVLFVPLGVVITGVQYLVFRVGGFAPLVGAAGSSNAVVGALAIALGVFFTVLGLAVVQATVAVAMVELDAGRPVTPLGAYRLAAPRLGPLLGALLIAGLAVAVADLLVIGTIVGAWLTVRWALTAQVAVLEGDGWRSALSRSARLVRGNFWRTGSLTLFVAGGALLLGPLLGSVLLFLTDASFNFINLVSSLVYAVVLPFVAIATTYLYLDLRIEDQREAVEEATGGVLPAEA